MVGVGNLHQQTVELARRLDVSDSVHFTGRLTPAEVMHQLATARVLLMTSVEGYEGYPRVLVEALAMGCSVVATRGADTGALIREGFNGWRTAATEEELARGIANSVPLDPADSVRSVSHLSAPEVISDLYAEETALPTGSPG
jgi:glycosyltransferase involved in cell wall biosynthesis